MPLHTSAPRTTLVLLTHTEPAGSRIDSSLALAVATLPDVEVRDLTALYPDGRIDAPAEQAALAGVRHIVLQYPADRYSVPTLLNRWLHEVLTLTWTDEPDMAGKTLRVMTSTSSVSDAYGTDSFHAWPYEDILKPLKAITKTLGMAWGEPLVVHGTANQSDANFAVLADQYRTLLKRINRSSSAPS